MNSIIPSIKANEIFINSKIMRLLTIVITYNAMRWLDQCIGSLLKSTIRSDIFVIDNGSVDGTQDHIRKTFPEVIFYQSKENLGFGKANNLGLQYALDNDYDYVYLLNQDAWVMPETFEILIKVSKKHPEYGVLSPFQTNADLHNLDRDFIKDVLSFTSNPNIINDMYFQHYSDVYPVSVVMAAHWLITKECITKVGGFSPSFLHYSEDYNYADRMAYRNIKVGIVPSIQVVHDRGWREDAKSKKIYLSYTIIIRMMSNPSNNPIKMFYLGLWILFKSIFKYKSLSPIKYAIEIIKKLNCILRNRKISIKDDCAFLNYTNK